MKLVKVPGSYGTYKVKEKWLTDEERTTFYLIGISILLVGLFY